MNKHLIIPAFLLSSSAGYAQFIVKDTLPPSFEWSYHLVDLPYMIDAAKAEHIRSEDGVASTASSVDVQDFGHFYRNLSMTQMTDMARNVHGTLYYTNNVLWAKWMKPTTTKKYILNRLFANATALATDYVAIKLPYAYAFQHEEFHRAVLSTKHIYSYDDVWNFGKGLDIAVSEVKDEDLIYLKSKYPADQVRLAAAGVEGEYVYFQRMREDNFFKQTGYPFVGLSVLGTLHAVNYVNLPFAERFNAITDSILVHDQTDILARDFTGYDFSAWVYDLFTPEEPYEARGPWPGGIGIKRPIKESDLTSEMKSFLRETGNMQYLNFVTPFMVGINRVQLEPGTYFNFALRSVPTSFGYFAGADLFLEKQQRQVMASLGVNRSHSLTLPYLQLKGYDILHSASKKVVVDLRLSGWMQPKDQLFFASVAQPGFSVGLQPFLTLSEHVSLFVDVDYKTEGWEFGNPYLDSQFSGSFGFCIRTNQQHGPAGSRTQRSN
ncbi:MAG: hypothetical protein ABIY71_13930 [Flavobacteriales bacterium]